MLWSRAGEILRPAMFVRFSHSIVDFGRALLRHWLFVLGGLAVGGWIYFAFWLSDIQGRMDLPQAYSVRMTCEDDPEADLWRGGCDRIAADMAKSGFPGFMDLYGAFVDVHHRASPREAAATLFAETSPEAGFDLAEMLKGQRYGLALVTPEFEGVKSRRHAEAVIEEIDTRDRALLVIGRAGLSQSALFAGALANLANPGVMIAGAGQAVGILMGTAKTSDIVTGLSERR